MSGPTFSLHQGDCLGTLRGMPDNSVDSICTDPPYGLSQHKPDEVVECLRAWLAGEIYKPKGKGFMGKEWDAWVPGPEVWRECLRVLKPGGHVLAFAGTRSMDLMSMAIRLAGFELRDAVGYAHDGGGAPLLAYCFGSGFPKSHDISKAIDREAGAEREVIGPNQWAERGGLVQANTYGAPSRPDATAPAPATEAARKWAGWGSALKPAWEPIILARKPLQGTLASNVLQWGTGGLNIDGCRIGTGDDRTSGGPPTKDPAGYFTMGGGWANTNERATGGRWPANLIHDGSPEVLAGFPQTAPSPTGPVKQGGHHRHDVGLSGSTREGVGIGYGDTGSAARFFYCAKASKRDRDEGLDEFEDKLFGMSSAAAAAAARGEHYDNGDGGVNRTTMRKNTHATVKPTALMVYLVRLVTPPGGTVLDPFMGSGSTGKACMREGFNFIGCELDPEYVAIARARIEFERLKRTQAANDAVPVQRDIFGEAA